MNFNDNVWQLCKKIPKGKVSTYKEIATALNSRAFRAVGNALNRNPYFPSVPCHRVINSDGRIGGYAKGLKAKAKLLIKEGHKIINGRIVNFDLVFFRF
jgi:methylated-DNA-[protein]-cysteine S-methyltransferase